MTKVYRTDIRFDTKAQKDRLALAAKQRHWSLNRFMLVAAEEFLRKLETVDMGMGLVPRQAQDEAGVL